MEINDQKLLRLRGGGGGGHVSLLRCPGRTWTLRAWNLLSISPASLTDLEVRVLAWVLFSGSWNPLFFTSFAQRTHFKLGQLIGSIFDVKLNLLTLFHFTPPTL
jgi:hypothetical protein